MAESCNNCRQMEARIRKLEVEIKRLQRKLERIRQYCQHLMVQSGAVLNRKSGVPRAVYVFNKAVYQVAKTILGLV